jgi:hypothetical protein
MATRATDQQVQNFVDTRFRPRAEAIRALYLACKDDKGAIDDVYLALTDTPTWIDSRSDAPPHLLAPSDALAINTFITGFISLVEGGLQADRDNAAAQYPKVVQSCVRAP